MACSLLEASREGNPMTRLQQRLRRAISAVLLLRAEVPWSRRAYSVLLLIVTTWVTGCWRDAWTDCVADCNDSPDPGQCNKECHLKYAPR